MKPSPCQLPTASTEGWMPASAGRSANRIEVYCDPRSVLSRTRLNQDYAEVRVKPRNREDGLLSWDLVADFSA